MRDTKRISVFKPFEENARKQFPYKSMYQITKELNKMLEDMIYGTKKINENTKKQKRKYY